MAVSFEANAELLKQISEVLEAEREHTESKPSNDISALTTRLPKRSFTETRLLPTQVCTC